MDFYNILIEIPKTNATKPHKNSVTFSCIKIKIGWKNGMKYNSHFASFVFGKILFILFWFFLAVTACITFIKFFITQGIRVSGLVVLLPL